MRGAGLASLICAAFLVSESVPLCLGQDTGVKPDINEPFQDPDLETFIGRFERDGREVFDQREKIVKACLLREGMDVADIGAGTGFLTRMFARAVGNKGTVYAVDISDEFIEHIRKTARQEGLSNIKGIVCDQKDTGLKPNSIDLAFMSDAYHHFEFPEKTLASIYRALRRGGQLIVIDFERKEGESDEWILEHIRADRGTVIREIQAAGFAVVGDADFLKENYFLRFLKLEPETR